jgi:hypothetical protein
VIIKKHSTLPVDAAFVGCEQAYATLDLFVKHKTVCKSKEKKTEHGKVKH